MISHPAFGRRICGALQRKTGTSVIKRGGFTPQGFEQSILKDIVFLFRFWRCRRKVICWQSPTEEEKKYFHQHPATGYFGEMTASTASVGTQVWVIRERLFYGWPDPPQYAFFCLVEGDVLVAADFNVWPKTWKRDKPDDRWATGTQLHTILAVQNDAPGPM